MGPILRVRRRALESSVERPGRGRGAVAGFVVGSIYGKYVLADIAGVKAHVTKEVGILRTAIATEIKKL